jgi:hypothetical protein
MIAGCIARNLPGELLRSYCYDVCLSRFVITALKAKEFHQRDVHYIVKDGHVEIVDEVSFICDKEINFYMLEGSNVAALSTFSLVLYCTMSLSENVRLGCRRLSKEFDCFSLYS